MSTLTVVGNLVQDLDVRFTPSGQQMTTGTVVENNGYKDKATGAWVEGEATFWPFVIWGEMGAHAVESVRKGDRVVLLGETRSNSWEDKTTGQKRTRVELTVREFGASMRFAQLRLSRRTRAEKPGEVPAAEDPWAVAGAPAEPAHALVG